MYIAGESYAGVYVPFLCNEIHEHNQKVLVTQRINLKGWMAGNACTHPSECYHPDSDDGLSYFTFKFLHNHAYFSDQEMSALDSACQQGYETPACQKGRSFLADKF